MTGPYTPANNYEAYKALPFDQKAPHFYEVEREKDYGHGHTFQVWARNRIGQGWSIARYTSMAVAYGVAAHLNQHAHEEADR